MNNYINSFFNMLKAGLWGNNIQDLAYKSKNFDIVYKLAQEQSVVGLLAAGLEKVTDVKVPKRIALTIAGEVLQLEQRNKAMNVFLTSLIEKMRTADICTILVKGQGIAQYYEKPLWRACGDVDLFLSDENYEKAKLFLIPMASEVEMEYEEIKHLGLTIEGWMVELHGSLRMGLPNRINHELDDIYKDTFCKKNVRIWDNRGSPIYLLGIENDIVYVFVHFLNHFFKEGVGLRQICDWCRLMWTYRDSLNYGLLESRIKRAGLVSEWKAFYNLASRYLGMPDLDSWLTCVESATSRHSSNKFGSAHDSIADFMVCDSRFDKKADRIMEFILKSGNMGHNRDMSHFSKYPYLIRKCVSMGRRISDLINHARIFPLDSLRFFPRIMFDGVRSAMKGE